MNLDVEWSEPAERDMRRLDKTIAEQIRRAGARFAADGQGDVAPLRPPLSGYRLRVRDWRVMFYLDREARTLTVRTVEHRSRAYRQQ